MGDNEKNNDNNGNVAVTFPESYLNGYTTDISNDKVAPAESNAKAEHAFKVDENEPYDPFAHRSVRKPVTNIDTAIHLIKANIGTGILAMPQAFKHSGLIVGSAGLAIIGFICVHCMHILLSCSHDLCRRTKTPAMTFSQVGEFSFKYGPPMVRRFSYAARVTIDSFLCITQLGFCCVFFVFVAASLQQLVLENLGYEMSIKLYLVILLVPMILLNWIRDLKPLTKFITLGNIFLLIGLLIIFYYIFQDIPPITGDRENFHVVFGAWSELPLYFGTTLYAYVAIGAILPLESQMKTPQNFGGKCGVLNISMVIVATLYIIVGFFGYVKYGDKAKGSVTLNLPEGAYLAMSVRLVMALSIFLSYAIQFYVPATTAWPICAPYVSCGKKNNNLAEYGFRTALVVLTFAVAISVPNLGLFISLVGAFCSSVLGLILPPVFGILCNWQKGYGILRWKLLKDLFLIFIGLACCFTSTYESLKAIIAGE